jgi:hypothetical protein
MFSRYSMCALALFCFSVGVVHAADRGLKAGAVELKSVGPIAFGPDGILFVSDPKAATIYAIGTGDTSGDASKATLNVEDLGGKISALLGAGGGGALIQDLAVNPASGKAYLSVTRGSGADAVGVIVTVDGAGKISALSLKDVAHSKVLLPNAPEDKVAGKGRRKSNNRNYSVTDIAYVDGRVIVTGLTNEEFASNLRAIGFPFKEADRGWSVEIFHGAHGRLETRSPVRTFVPLVIKGQPQIIAAYTCTPLVRFPLSSLKPGQKVRGTTIAELGNHNRPLDIIAYKKDGKSFLLMSNSARGVMKISTDQIGSREGLVKKVSGIAGQPYETIDALKGVVQLDRLNETTAAILVSDDSKKLNLKTVALP